MVQEFSVKEEVNPAAIRIANVSYSYGSVNNSIENINLSIADNDFVAVIGRNGCGKSTLLKIITGLLRPDSGEIFIRGKNSKGLSISAISREIGFVMQNPDAQLFSDTVYKEVSFGLRNSGLSESAIRSRAEAALSETGLEGHKDEFPLTLSRGDRAKTIIACVLAMGCRIIILDEPDTRQDYRGSRQIMDIAATLHKQGYTIIFVTHNMSLAAEYAHRIIVMGGKGICMDGNPREVFYRASELVALKIIPPQIVRLSLELRKELRLELDSLNAVEMGKALLRNKTV
jgi:energy-coupling factor transport system ATP-binding protein